MECVKDVAEPPPTPGLIPYHFIRRGPVPLIQACSAGQEAIEERKLADEQKQDRGVH